METLYRKVEIKSEQDLPKNDTYCFCHHKNKGERWDRYLTNYNKDWWLMNIDWYLQPIEPQEPQQTPYDAETIALMEKYGVTESDVEAALKIYCKGKIEPKQTAGFMQTRDLTEEEWMKLPKAEILQLYKNCYQMLMNYIKLSGEKIPEVQTVTSTDYKPDKPKPLAMTVNEYYKIK